MLKVHYDLLQQLTKKLDSRPLSHGDNRTVGRMEQDPDAYLASVLNLLVESFRPRNGGYSYIASVLPFAGYEPNMKKMRKLLEQYPGEYVPEHAAASHEQ